MKSFQSYLFLTLFCLVLLPVKGQILHSENFSVILDTTKVIKGNFLPSFRYRNVKEEFYEIENTADISLKLGKNVFNLANKFEYARFGSEDIMSGGFLYLEYMRLGAKGKIAVEPYALRLWQEIRGLELKYALGSNFRYIVLRKNDFGIFLGLGSFYEWEQWNYEGTGNPELIPENAEDILIQNWRLSSYLNVKKDFGDWLSMDCSWYYQPAVQSFWDAYRMALSAEITYNINSQIGLSLVYQNIYDPKPVVPIPFWYNDISLGFSFSF